MLLKVGIGQVRTGVCIEAKRDLRDDVAVAVRGVEDAVTVGKAALLMAEGNEGVGFEIERTDVGNGAGDLLPVSPDVLDWRAADAAGDSGKAFDAADSLLADRQDEAVPVHSGCGGAVNQAATAKELQRSADRDRDMDDQSIEAGVADEKVASSAESKDFESTLTRKLDRLQELVFAGDFRKKTGWATDAKGGVRRERNIFLDLKARRRHGLRVQHRLEYSSRHLA